MSIKFDDVNELLHAIRMKARGANYASDPGDEDDLSTHPRRMWSRITIGRALYYQPLSWTHEHLPPLPEHDPGDEDHFAWLRPNSDITNARMAKRFFGER